MPYDKSNQNNTIFQKSDSFKINTYTVIMDYLLAKITKKKKAYVVINLNFVFFISSN